MLRNKIRQYLRLDMVRSLSLVVHYPARQGKANSVVGKIVTLILSFFVIVAVSFPFLMAFFSLTFMWLMLMIDVKIVPTYEAANALCPLACLDQSALERSPARVIMKSSKDERRQKITFPICHGLGSRG